MGAPVFSPVLPRARIADGIFVGAVAAVLAVYAVSWLGWHIATPTQLDLNEHLKYWLYSLADAVGYSSYQAERYAEYLKADFSMQVRMALAAVAASSAGLYAGWLAGKPLDGLIVTDGYLVAEGKEAIKKLKKVSGIFKEKGLKIGDWHLSFDKESKHFLLAGGTGSGKSVTLTNILLPVIARGDRVLLIDFKGLTEIYPTRLGKDLAILSPIDARDIGWDVAADLTNTQHIKDFVWILQNNADDADFFDDAAANIAIGTLISCARDYGKNWTFKIASDRLNSTREEFVELLKTHYPRAVPPIIEAGKMADSVLAGVPTLCDIIHDLADLYGDKKGKLSMREWAINPKTKYKNLILKTSTEFSKISSAFNRMILAVLKSNLTKMPDVKPDTNPIWLIVDEFPQLGKIEWASYLEVGRSKSMRCVMCIQSASQLINIYGQAVSDSWIDSIGTKIFGSQDGVGAEWVEKVVGKISGERLNISNTEGGGNTFSYVPFSDKPAFSANRVKNDLGPNKRGVRMLVHGLTKNGDVVVDFSFSNTKKLRKADIENKRIRIKKSPAPNISSATTQSAITTVNEHNDYVIESGVEDQKEVEILKDEIEMLDMITSLNKVEEVDNFRDEAVEKIEKEAAIEVTEMIIDMHGIGLAIEAIELLEDVENETNNNVANVEIAQQSVSKKKRKRLSAREALELAK